MLLKIIVQRKKRCSFSSQNAAWSGKTALIKKSMLLFLLPDINQTLAIYTCLVANKGISQTFPGLFFTGMSWQRSFASTTLWGVGDDANFVVKNIRKYIRSPFKQRLAVIQ
ncbi:hypothetical protein [Paenibacillus sp. GP183]|jgi:hypothetical protein|uniref:hypothetical protein n=1 Tax=Paenibacillus sp. GP183 TaxID=1882751 RepID=UPI000B88F1EE|nr:hypothetical protein [Paenibacillus sp. GP183]